MRDAGFVHTNIDVLKSYSFSFHLGFGEENKVLNKVFKKLKLECFCVLKVFITKMKLSQWHQIS